MPFTPWAFEFFLSKGTQELHRGPNNSFEAPKYCSILVRQILTMDQGFDDSPVSIVFPTKK